MAWTLLGCALASSIVLASPPPPPPAAPAEEPRVARVRVDAPPPEAARLGHYVEVKEGEPLRPEQVRHAVELFYATGELEDVRVSVETTPAGLEVVFHPVFAPLLSSVEVEGDALLAPAAVRRVSRLRDREPLWPDRLERAARDVAVALGDDGYLEAQVTAVARPDPAGPVAVFRVHAGPRVYVARVEVRGAPPGLDGLRGRVRPGPGQVYRRARAEEATHRLEQALRLAGYWRAEVTRRDSYDPRTARLSLAFDVAPGPRTWLEVRGASLSRGTRHGLERRLREGGARTDVLEEAADRIEAELKKAGHRSPAVTRREEPRPTGLAIVYDVKPGPVARVASVEIMGTEPGSLFRLLATRAGDPLRDGLLAEDARTLGRALQDQGYPEARVEAEAPEGGGELPVIFRTRPGPHVQVASFRIESPEPVPPESVAREMSVRAATPYRAADVAHDRDGLLSAYRDAGYPQVEVVPEVTFSDTGDEAQVVLRVSPGPRVKVDHVVIAGLQTTREEVVRRELLIKEGEALGLAPMLETQRRLGGLGLFDRVNLSEMDPESATSRSVVVSAQEAARTTVAYGIGYGERDLLRGSVEVARRNLFGLDRSLTAFVRYSFNGSRLLATFHEPYAFGRRQEVFLTAFRDEEHREAFDFVRAGGLVQGARTLGHGWSAVARYTYQLTDSFNIANPDQLAREFTTSTFSGPSGTLINDSRDDAFDPHRGRFVSADLQLSHRALGGDSFAKGFVQMAVYERLTTRLVLAVGGRLGLSRTFGDEPLLLPRPDRFYAGGDYSLRGFKLDSVGPRAPDGSGTLVATGGNALVLGSAEMRMDAGRYFSVAAFSDVGNVYALVSGLDLGDLRYSAGLGLRYRSSLGPVRLDWGYKLNRRVGEGPYAFHLTLGHAF